MRIIIMGGSTTQTGYPQILGDFLNKHKNDPSYSIETMNFGRGVYTSAHMLVNFVLNVVDFSPDYIIIHQGWNDFRARDTGRPFKSDYSHAFKIIEEPFIPDRIPIRVSIVYRYIKNRVQGQPSWGSLENIVTKERLVTPRYENLNELKTYERNIRTIIDLAILRDIRVVLTTQPHSTDPKHYTMNAKHIDQCNDILRNIFKSYGDKILFVDLDEVMTGKTNDVFYDIGHVNKRGKTIKAQKIGEIILSDLGNKR